MAKESSSIEEFANLPLRYAYQFLTDKSLNEQSNEIRYSTEKYGSYDWALKRAKMINYLDSNDLLSEFIDNY